MSLRLATPDDIEQVGKLLWLMLDEIGIGAVNEPKAREAVARSINENSCLVTEWQGEIVGVLGLVMTSWW